MRKKPFFAKKWKYDWSVIVAWTGGLNFNSTRKICRNNRIDLLAGTQSTISGKRTFLGDWLWPNTNTKYDVIVEMIVAFELRQTDRPNLDNWHIFPFPFPPSSDVMWVLLKLWQTFHIFLPPLSLWRDTRRQPHFTSLLDSFLARHSRIRAKHTFYLLI